ncbi:MAG TPA: phosphotransferase [Gemmataceae bacterium]|nr:phosphotransferase [Gemmataceae bacterium]
MSPVAPTPATLVADEFLSYLQIRRGMSVPGYLRAPVEVPDGWETYTYYLQLHGRNRLPPEFRQPLTLRVLAGPEGLPRLRREWRVQNWLAQQGYPVARPLLREEDAGFLGGPFMLMQWVDGTRLLERILRDYFALLWAPARMAEVHAQLHALPVQDLPQPRRSFLDRQLETFQAVVDECGVHGLAPGVDWLRAHRPAEIEAPCLLHLDFHAKNILTHGARIAAVLDWSEAQSGDRHADVAMALLMIDVAPVQDASRLDRLMLPIGRFLTHHLYLNAYRSNLPLDRRRLRYYQAWAAMWRLSYFGRWLTDGPHVTGYKPTAVRHVRKMLVSRLERYFQRFSGTAIRLGLPVAPGEE